MRPIVVLISGDGSNMDAIVKASLRDDWAGLHRARVAAVISNRADAGGLRLARAHGIATEVLVQGDFAGHADPRASFDAELVRTIDRYQPALVVLAGFMRILSDGFVARYEGRLLNIHPSLLPAFAGLNTHARVLAAGCRFSGATVHQVTAQLDGGPILAQAVVPVLESDTPQSLASRVLSQEHLIYPATIARWLRQRAG